MSTNPLSQSLLLTLEERRARLGDAPLNDKQKAKLERLSKDPRFQALEEKYYTMCPNAPLNSFQAILTQAILRGEAELDRVLAAQVAQTEAEVLREEQAEAEAHRREQMQGGELESVGTRKTGYESRFREEVDVKVLDRGVKQEPQSRNVIPNGELWEQDSEMEVEPGWSEDETEIEAPQENKGTKQVQMAAKQAMQAQTTEAATTQSKKRKRKKKNKNKNATSKLDVEAPGIQLPYTASFDKSKHSWSFLHVDGEEEREANRKIRPVTPLELQQMALADEAARRQLNSSKNPHTTAKISAAIASSPPLTPCTAQYLPGECHQCSQHNPSHSPNCVPCPEPRPMRKRRYPIPEPRQRIFKVEDDGTTTFYGPRGLVNDFFRDIEKEPDKNARKASSAPVSDNPTPTRRAIYSPFPRSVQNRPPAQKLQPKQEPKQQCKALITRSRPRSSNVNITGIQRPKNITLYSPAPQVNAAPAKSQPQAEANFDATPQEAIDNLFDFEEHFDRQMANKYYSYSNFLPRVPTAIHSCSPTQGQGGERIFKQACTASCAGQCVTISAGEDERFVSWLEREYEERLERTRRKAGHEGDVSGLEVDVPTGLAPPPRPPNMPDSLKKFLGIETDQSVSVTGAQIIRPKPTDDKPDVPTPISLPPPPPPPPQSTSRQPQTQFAEKDPQPITTQYANVIKHPADEILPPPPLGGFSQFPRHEIRPRSLQYFPQPHQQHLGLQTADHDGDRIYATPEEETEFTHMLAANFEVEVLEPENEIPAREASKHRVMAKEMPSQPGHESNSSASVDTMASQVAKALSQLKPPSTQTQSKTQPQLKSATTTNATTATLQTPLDDCYPNLNPKLKQYYTLNLDDERPLPSRIPKPIRHANAPLSGRMSVIAQRRYFERLEVMLAEIQKAEPAERLGCLYEGGNGDEVYEVGQDDVYEVGQDDDEEEVRK